MKSWTWILKVTGGLGLVAQLEWVRRDSVVNVFRLKVIRVKDCLQLLGCTEKESFLQRGISRESKRESAGHRVSGRVLDK